MRFRVVQVVAMLFFLLSLNSFSSGTGKNAIKSKESINLRDVLLKYDIPNGCKKKINSDGTVLITEIGSTIYLPFWVDSYVEIDLKSVEGDLRTYEYQYEEFDSWDHFGRYEYISHNIHFLVKFKNDQIVELKVLNTSTSNKPHSDGMDFGASCRFLGEKLLSDVIYYDELDYLKELVEKGIDLKQKNNKGQDAF